LNFRYLVRECYVIGEDTGMYTASSGKKPPPSAGTPCLASLGESLVASGLQCGISLTQAKRVNLVRNYSPRPPPRGTPPPRAGPGHLTSPLTGPARALLASPHSPPLLSQLYAAQRHDRSIRRASANNVRIRFTWRCQAHLEMPGAPFECQVHLSFAYLKQGAPVDRRWTSVTPGASFEYQGHPGRRQGLDLWISAAAQ
jgi:hypothetical protein